MIHLARRDMRKRSVKTIRSISGICRLESAAIALRFTRRKNPHREAAAPRYWLRSPYRVAAAVRRSRQASCESIEAGVLRRRKPANRLPPDWLQAVRQPLQHTG